MRFKIMIGGLMGLGIMILIPIGIDYFIIGNNFYSNISNSDWVAFLGSYIGSIIGGLFGLIGIIMTIKYTEHQSQKEREFTLDMNREDRRLAIAPLFIFNTNSKNFTEFDEIVGYSTNEPYPFSEFRLLLEISNVGLGDAADLSINFDYFGSKQGIVIDFFKRHTAMKILIDLDISFKEIPKNFEEIIKGMSRSEISNELDKYGYGLQKLNIEILYKDLVGNEYNQELKLSISGSKTKEKDGPWMLCEPSGNLTYKKAVFNKQI